MVIFEQIDSMMFIIQYIGCEGFFFLFVYTYFYVFIFN